MLTAISYSFNPPIQEEKVGQISTPAVPQAIRRKENFPNL